MMKKALSILLVIGMLAALLTGCGSSDSTSSQAASQAGSNAGTGERQTINFWYHSAETVTDAYFQKILAEINEAQSDYTFEYTSFSFADFQKKFQMAVTTDTMPDVVSLGFSNIATFVAQDSLLPLDDYVDQIEEYDSIDKQLLSSLQTLGDGTMYGIPFAYNQEVAWYNTKLFTEKKIDKAPETQAQFLEMCEQYADQKNGTYFTSMRGVRPYDSLLAWLFTYTDGAGYKGSWFDKEDKCILRDPSFVEALDAYVNIYKNKWVSGDSVNNNFSEVVAEFGSGVSMYIVHNSSSESTHRQNLGDGNFAAARVLANDQGHYFASGLQPNVYCVANQGKDHDYTGALKLISYLTTSKYEGGLCQEVGRVPCNAKVAEQDWYKDNPNMKLYESYLSDSNYYQIQNPYWLSDFSTFITDEMTADFQAVLLGEMKSADVLAKWADQIDGYQSEYLASKK